MKLTNLLFAIVVVILSLNVPATLLALDSSENGILSQDSGGKVTVVLQKFDDFLEKAHAPDDASEKLFIDEIKKVLSVLTIQQYRESQYLKKLKTTIYDRYVLRELMKGFIDSHLKEFTLDEFVHEAYLLWWHNAISPHYFDDRYLLEGMSISLGYIEQYLDIAQSADVFKYNTVNSERLKKFSSSDLHVFDIVIGNMLSERTSSLERFRAKFPYSTDFCNDKNIIRHLNDLKSLLLKAVEDRIKAEELAAQEQKRKSFLDLLRQFDSEMFITNSASTNSIPTSEK